MAKLHELLAAEKTPMAAWNQVQLETLQKFKNPSHFFDGHSRSLAMIEDSPANKATEDQAREEKVVTTTVYETLEYALDLFGKSEDLQFQKNATNRKATASIMWNGAVLLADMPVDELLGLEARLTKIRELIAAVPTLDASKRWLIASNSPPGVWTVVFPEDTIKTDKQVIPITLKEATKEHPAQVQAIQKDVTVGKFTTIKRSGAATALQKANAFKCIDMLLVEIKQARMRANETVVESGSVAAVLVPLLLDPFKV